MNTTKNLSVLILIIFSSLLFGQKKYIVDIGSGISFPTGPNNFKQYWKTGYGFTGGLGITPKENIHALLDFEYTDFSFNNDKFTNDLMNRLINITNNNCKVLSLAAKLKFDLKKTESTLFPFIYFGAGWMRYTTKNLTVYFNDQSIQLGGESKNLLILLAGGGLEYYLNELLDLTLELNYRYGSIDNYRIDFLPIKLGLIFKVDLPHIKLWWW